MRDKVIYFFTKLYEVMAERPALQVCALGSEDGDRMDIPDGAVRNVSWRIHCGLTLQLQSLHLSPPGMFSRRIGTDLKEHQTRYMNAMASGNHLRRNPNGCKRYAVH